MTAKYAATKCHVETIATKFHPQGLTFPSPQSNCLTGKEDRLMVEPPIFRLKVFEWHLFKSSLPAWANAWLLNQHAVTFSSFNYYISICELCSVKMKAHALITYISSIYSITSINSLQQKISYKKTSNYHCDHALITTWSKFSGLIFALWWFNMSLLFQVHIYLKQWFNWYLLESCLILPILIIAKPFEQSYDH